MIIEVVLLAICVLITLLTITGYDKYLALKLKARIIRSGLARNHSNSSNAFGPRVKKVKVIEIGSYLVITMVISKDVEGEGAISVSDLIPLLPLTIDEDVNITS